MQGLMQDVALPWLLLVAKPGEGTPEHCSSFASSWGWLALSLHSLHPEVLRGARSSPGIRSPSQLAQQCLGAGLSWAAWGPRQET